MNNKDKRPFESIIYDLNIINKYLIGMDTTKEFQEEKEHHSIDMLLDQYNDYMTLYNMFADEEYKVMAEEVLNELKQIH
ncbi:hypothetical protein KDN24_06495 [Bacillus sp. Bva_UNVM-123]|uniref:hypothetical protein n=1 Tax=Bacillus sp. Bva_UNVM-123 TaxID=2829798 RepID=UPI00391FA847